MAGRSKSLALLPRIPQQFHRLIYLFGKGLGTPAYQALGLLGEEIGEETSPSRSDLRCELERAVARDEHVIDVIDHRGQVVAIVTYERRASMAATRPL